MSGHSKWAKIKRQKGVKDVKRGAIFTKLARNVSLAASEGGGDPDLNFALRLAITKAKSANMPADNIERAIKKGTGESNANTFQKLSYEAILPGNIALIIDAQTDNPNRTVAEVRSIIEGAGAKMASPGSVNWQFSEKGFITIQPKRIQKAEKYGAEDDLIEIDPEELELELLDLEGIEDINESERETDGVSIKVLEITTGKNEFAKVLKSIEEKQLKLETAELVKHPNELLEVDETTGQKVSDLVENLEDHDDIDSVWTNI